MHLSSVELLLLFLAAATCSFSLFTNALQQAQPTDVVSPSCIPQEREALLAFKQGITGDPAGLLKSWQKDGDSIQQDCCRWRGIQCSNRTGHVLELRLRNEHADYYNYTDTALVGQISHSLLSLERLEHLDLSMNSLLGSTSRIPKFLGSFKFLTYLNLSGIPFSGRVPPQLGNLSTLQYLDLSHMGRKSSNDLSWLKHLHVLQYLNLHFVDLSTVVDWPYVVNTLPSLRVLDLSRCSLQNANQLLHHHNLTNLLELDLHGNYFNHPIASAWFWNITSLKHLSLWETSMHGQLPHALGGLVSLEQLDVSRNRINSIMTNINDLCSLRILYLERCFLHGSISQFFEMLPKCSTNKLHELHLLSNQLNGILPNWMGQLTKLVILDLNKNNITGPLPVFIGNLTSLMTLHLADNHLNGGMPYEISALVNLTELFLNNNAMDGVITEEHFGSLKSLKSIDLSCNSFKIKLSKEWQPPFKLYSANFAACEMGPQFPAWLEWQDDIVYLDISSASLEDSIPNWFSSTFSKVGFLNISNNQLTGGLPADIQTMSLEELFLSSNKLTGQIPSLPRNIQFLDLSMNSFWGPLPINFDVPQLVQLSLFSNNLTGRIPQSICKCEGLMVLDLANNFLEGELPLCSGMTPIMTLELSNNSLSGEFPSFVQNCKYIQFLDLARNNFSGTLPMWLGNLTGLQFIRLSHNMFSGTIPTSITKLGCLQYLDLAGNNLSGSLPNMSNFTAMRLKYSAERYAHESSICDYTIPAEYQSVSLSTVTKGQLLDYGSGYHILYIKMMSIDLSLNYLKGELPEDIVNLDALYNLNLSMNQISGNIPNKIGAMHLLESLDLSRNKLCGEIPESLSYLTFLSYLDMSYNNLTGTIPSGSQLDTIYAAHPSIYNGNVGLCGPPLKNNCSNSTAPTQAPMRRTIEGPGPDFFYLGLGCGMVAGIWAVFCSLLFKNEWKIAFFLLYDKAYVHLLVFSASLSRQNSI